MFRKIQLFSADYLTYNLVSDSLAIALKSAKMYLNNTTNAAVVIVSIIVEESH